MRKIDNKMVILPRLNLLTVLVLAEQLLALAVRKAAELPALIKRPMGRLQAAMAAFKSAIPPRAEDQTDDKQESDQLLDDAWRAINRWVEALLLMKEKALPERPRVVSLDELLFSEGLTFINAAYREEWSESETRLKARSP